MYNNQPHPNQRKQRLGFLHRGQNQGHRNVDQVPHKQHFWTATARDTDVNTQPSASTGTTHTTIGGRRGGLMGGLFGRNRQQSGPNTYGAHHTGQNYGPHDDYDRSISTTTANNTYYGTSQSDWDHYAVRHEDSLIGDPVPYADNSMNGPVYGPYGYRNFGYGNGPLQGDHYIPDASGYVHNAPGRYPDNWTSNPAKTNYSGRDANRFGPGPIVADIPVDHTGRPLTGNYSTGTLIENTGFPNRYGNLNANNANKLNSWTHGQGPYGPEHSSHYIDPVDGSDTWTTTSVNYVPGPMGTNAHGTVTGPLTTGPMGTELSTGPMTGAPVPTTGRKSRFGSWFGSSMSNEPLWGGREVRDSATPLLPDNPWTHNELSREYIDSRQTLNGLPRATGRRNTTGYNGAVYGPNTTTTYGPTTTRTYVTGSPAMGRMGSPMVGRNLPVPPPLPPVYVPRSSMEPEHYRFRQGSVHVLDDGYNSGYYNGPQYSTTTTERYY